MRTKIQLSALILSLFCFLSGIGYCSDNVIENSVSSFSITGYCFNDINKSSIMDADEQGIQGRTLSLKRINLFTLRLDEIGTLETLGDGSYAFVGLKKGLYIVEENSSEDTLTTPNKYFVFIGRLQTRVIKNFGFFIEIFPVPTVILEAEPLSIKKGASSKLTWTSTNADSVFINQGIGEVDASGFIDVYPQETTTYEIRASGKGGTKTDSITVFVSTDIGPPAPEAEEPTASLSVSSQQVNAGDEITLTWTSTNADKAALNESIGVVDLNGNKKVTVYATTTYTLTILGLNGSIVKASAIVTVASSGNSGASTTIGPITTTSTINTTSTTTITSPGDSTTTTTQMPTAILLASFVAESENQSVSLVWKTESEINTYGFSLYRSETEDKDFGKINDYLIASQGSPTEGASYRYIDKEVKIGHTYYYKLEDIDFNGKSTFYGPVHSIPGR